MLISNNFKKKKKEQNLGLNCIKIYLFFFLDYSKLQRKREILHIQIN